MKRGNPAMSKPSLTKINSDLNRFTIDESSNRTYLFECPRCGDTFLFKETDLKERVLRCEKCGYEEIFFRSMYKQ